MSELPDRLYALPHAEDAHFDLAHVYELEIDPFLEKDPDSNTKPVMIEELSVRKPDDFVPSAAVIVEQLLEGISEFAGGEYAMDWYDSATKDEGILAAGDALRAAVIKTISWLLADKTVAEHVLSWDDEGEPLVDGERLYRKRT